MGTDKSPEPWEEAADYYDDIHHNPGPDPDWVDECYYCGREYNASAMISHEVTVLGEKKEVFACGNCEHRIP